MSSDAVRERPPMNAPGPGGDAEARPTRAARRAFRDGPWLPPWPGPAGAGHDDAGSVHVVAVVVAVVIVVAAVLPGQVFDLVDQAARLAAKVALLALGDGLIAEGGRIEHRLDLPGERVALRGDRRRGGEPGRVGGVVARDGAVGHVEAVAAERAERGVELLVGFCQLDELLLALAQGMRPRLLVEMLDQHAAVMHV